MIRMGQCRQWTSVVFVSGDDGIIIIKIILVVMVVVLVQAMAIRMAKEL